MMIEVMVYVKPGASLARFEQIAGELAAAGVEVRAKVPGIGVIRGAVATRDQIPELRKISGIKAVTERRER